MRPFGHFKHQTKPEIGTVLTAFLRHTVSSLGGKYIHLRPRAKYWGRVSITNNWLLNQKYAVGTRGQQTFHLIPTVNIQGCILMLNKKSSHVGLFYSSSSSSSSRKFPQTDGSIENVVSTTQTGKRVYCLFSNLKPNRYCVRTRMPARWIYYSERSEKMPKILEGS